MTATIAQQRSTNTWNQFCEWVTSTNNRLYVGWFGAISVTGLHLPIIVFMSGGLVY
jgi:photosystem II P680 reaction center D1 protein